MCNSFMLVSRSQFLMWRRRPWSSAAHAQPGLWSRRGAERCCGFQQEVMSVSKQGSARVTVGSSLLSHGSSIFLGHVTTISDLLLLLFSLLSRLRFLSSLPAPEKLLRRLALRQGVKRGLHRPPGSPHALHRPPLTSSDLPRTQVP